MDDINDKIEFVNGHIIIDLVDNHAPVPRDRMTKPRASWLIATLRTMIDIRN